MGRGAGTGKGSYADGFEFGGKTPGGISYWIKKGGDPRVGFIDDPTREGQQPGTVGYPIAYIDYYWKNPNAPLEATNKVKVEQQFRELTVTGATGRIPLVYGRARIGGGVLAWRGIGPYVYMSLGMCHGPISGYASVRLMDQAASLVGGAPFGASALFQTEVGIASPVGAVPSYYSSATTGQGVERFPYLATIHCRFDTFLYPNIHQNPLFTLDGRLLRDPRLGVDGNGIPNQPEVFAKNVMLAIADYCTSPIYGPGYADDTINWDSVADVADYCDVLVAGLPRHTINWAIMKDGVPHRSVIEAMMALARIRRFRRDGKIVFAAKKITSRAGVFTPNNSLPVEAEIVDLSTVPNVVKGTFTNPSKDYQDDAAEPAMTAEALARTEPRLPTTVSREGTITASECRRENVFQLGELRNDLRFVFDATKADALQYEPMDRIGYFSNTASLGVSAGDPQDGWVEKTQVRSNGVVRFYCTKYDESYLSDATQVTESAPTNTTVPPTDPPDAPTSPAAAASLTIGDGLELYLPGRVRVDWTHPGWPYALKYRVTIETADDPETVVAELESGPVFVDIKTLLSTVRVYAFVLATGATSAALTGTIAAADPPEVINGGINGGISTTATISWDAPKDRSTTTYATSFWASVSLVSYDGTKVNDGLTSATAFTTPAGTSRLKHDAGAGGKRFREVSIYGLESAGVNGGAQIQYSTDDAAWTSVTIQPSPEIVGMGGGVYRSTYAWADPGASKRYWRINFSATSNTIREVHLSEYGSAFADILEYRVYDVRGAGRELFTVLPPGAVPTATTPLNVEAITSRVELTWDTSGSMVYEVLVVVVNAAGVESDGAYFLAATVASASGDAAPYVPQTSNVLTLANGLNSDIFPSAGPGLQAIAGPSAAFSVGGIVASATEWMPLHYSGTQAMTIVNEDASSTAANRIVTATGANIVLIGPCRMLLWRDVAASRWVVAIARDKTITLNNGNVGIGTATAARLIDARSSSVAVGPFMSLGNSDLTSWLGTFGGQTDFGPAFHYPSTQTLRIGTATSAGAAGFVERAKFTSAGNLEIGTNKVTAGTMTVVSNGEADKPFAASWTNAMVVALGAVTAGDILVCTLPAKARVKNVLVALNTAATGSPATLTVQVGRTSANYDDYIAAGNAKAAANTIYGNVAGERGGNNTGYDAVSMTATTPVYARFISTVANLSTVLTCTGTVYIEVEIMP